MEEQINQFLLLVLDIGLQAKLDKVLLYFVTLHSVGLIEGLLRLLKDLIMLINVLK